MNTNLAEDIAYNCLVTFGYGADRISPDTNLLALAQKTPLCPHLDFSEEYFYEEIAFANQLIIEAEARFNFMSGMIELFLREGKDISEIEIRDITRSLSAITYRVASERMELVGIEATPLSGLPDMNSLLTSRWKQYGALLSKSVSSANDIEMSEWNLGLSPRDHPRKEYLGYVADNICRSLKKIQNSNVQVSVEIAVSFTWSSAMKVAKSFLE